MFYYADECNLSWLPTLRTLWSPQGQQVLIPTSGQTTRYYGIGAVNYHTGETVVQFERRKRRRAIAHLLEALVAQHPTGSIYVAWDNADTHTDDEACGVGANPCTSPTRQPPAEQHLPGQTSVAQRVSG